MEFLVQDVRSLDSDCLCAETEILLSLCKKANSEPTM